VGITRTSAYCFDRIWVLEASYDLEESDSHWLTRIMDQVSPLLSRGTNPLSWTFRCTSTSFSRGSFSESTPQALIFHVARLMGDRFCSDLRRFIVATKNDPAHPDPRA
jgi:hypothetical protein